MHNHDLGRAQFLEHLSQWSQPVRIKNANDLTFGPGGVGQRAQQIEQRTHGHLAARSDGVLHC